MNFLHPTAESYSHVIKLIVILEKPQKEVPGIGE